MPKNLSKLFRSATKKTSSDPALATLKKLLPSHQAPKSRLSSQKTASETAPSVSHRVSSDVLLRFKSAVSKDATASCLPNHAEDSAKEISRKITSILLVVKPLEGHALSRRQVSEEIIYAFQGDTGSDQGLPPSEEANDTALVKSILDVQWFSNVPQTCSTQRKKEVSRERKQRYVFKKTESRRFAKLMKMCADKLGAESTLEVFGKLGRDTGINEYNALIKLCISNAMNSNDEDESLSQIHNAYRLLMSMRERGFQIEEESYGVFLMYMVEMGMIEEFQVFSELIKNESSRSSSRIGYYEMLLWIRAGDEDKVRELCNRAGSSSTDDNSYDLAESYLLAFCESDRKDELLPLLEVLDIRKVTSLQYTAVIFRSLGRLQLENFVERFILTLKTTEDGDKSISPLIYDYAISIPNLVVEEVILKFNKLHEKLEVVPSTVVYGKLIALCCESFKVHAAVDVVELMCESGLDVPVETFHQILRACEQNYELDLVRPIYSMMCRYNLRPNGDAIKTMICLYVKMKDFEGAYNLLTGMQEMNEVPTASMYNAILAGYFRERNTHGALMVLKQMVEANLNPDSETFCYLISNCDTEEDVNKYLDQMQHCGVQTTKHVYMSLINVYSKFGRFDIAKQVILKKEVPVKYVNELKSVLVSALSYNGQVSDALNVYNEIKQAGVNLEPKAVISLIENMQSEGELDRLLQLLGELTDSSNWFDGCSRVISYCVRYNIADSAVDLLKQLKKKDESSTYIVIDQIFCQIWEAEPANVEIGLKLLRAVKEQLYLHPSRTSLDFLLSSCVKSGNAQHAQLVWSEYTSAGLSYNVLTFLRMYQVLLASGKHKHASKLLKGIPKDDPHVCHILKSCKTAFKNHQSADRTN